MKHRRTGRIFGRVRNQRKALMKTLLGSLILHERITTTEAKAKEMKNFIDQLVNKAKTAKGDETKRLAMIRLLSQQLPKVALEKLTQGEFIDHFEGRESGYVRVVKLGQRMGDGAKMAIIEFVF
ncbi:MAG: 50S ribosomal protein L17 [Candidatus Moraniibacteriota bacterium]